MPYHLPRRPAAAVTASPAGSAWCLIGLTVLWLALCAGRLGVFPSRLCPKPVGGFILRF